MRERLDVGPCFFVHTPRPRTTRVQTGEPARLTLEDVSCAWLGLCSGLAGQVGMRAGLPLALLSLLGGQAALPLSQVSGLTDI